ncbi:hypothetical protein JHK85_004788 [Glycine max]|nr:hypothetical protein JHK85_004788 [Glycine max]KAG5080550.1 hypothetical protein JHK86_004615 [Glycine max]
MALSNLSKSSKPQASLVFLGSELRRKKTPWTAKEEDLIRLQDVVPTKENHGSGIFCDYPLRTQCTEFPSCFLHDAVFAQKLQFFQMF